MHSRRGILADRLATAWRLIASEPMVIPIRRIWWNLVAVRLSLASMAATALVAAPAQACMSRGALDLNDLRYADAVVVGRIANYRRIRDDEIGFGYARFEIEVTETLEGRAPRRVT